MDGSTYYTQHNCLCDHDVADAVNAPGELGPPLLLAALRRGVYVNIVMSLLRALHYRRGMGSFEDSLAHHIGGG